MERTSRGGFGLPTACTMCNTPCPNNLANTIFSLIEAVEHDVMQAVRLALVCLGSGGIQKCICAAFRALEPDWLAAMTCTDERSSEQRRCRKRRCESDPMMLIMETILSTVALMAEGPINNMVWSVNSVLNSILETVSLGFSETNNDEGPVPKVCFSLPDHMGPRVCNPPPPAPPGGAQSNFLDCYDASKGEEYMCYFKRREEICLSRNARDEYEALFDVGTQSTEELQAEYRSMMGDTYTTLSPAIADLFENVGTTNENRDFKEQKNICDNFARNGMRLDDVIVACIFAMVNQLCDYSDAADLVTTLQSTEWKLPDVRWTFDVSPPPPPSKDKSIYDSVMENDPEGYELMKAKMEEWCAGRYEPVVALYC